MTRDEFLNQRDQLMQQIDCIVDDYFLALTKQASELGEVTNFDEARDDLVTELCDAVCNIMDPAGLN